METLSNRTTFYILALSSFAVFSQWAVWHKGVFALGLNTSIVGVGFWLVLLGNRKLPITKSDILWLAPLWIVVLSFSLYENPWLKWISVVIFPLAIGLIYSFRQMRNCDNLDWTSSLLRTLVGRTIAPICYFAEAKNSLASLFRNLYPGAEKSVLKRVLLGLLFLIPIATIALLLLSAADGHFLDFIHDLITSLFGLINITILVKVIFVFVLTVLICSVLCAWQGEGDHQESKMPERSTDEIVVGIVVAGILVIYILFLYFQIDYLAVTNLPIEFVASEKIVKSGFWQLIFLSALNVILFSSVYKNTSQAIHILLTAFLLASSLILLSAAWRLGLYAYWYGLSYEKFFACYTVIYTLMIFVYLVVLVFSNKRGNIVKSIVLSATWFYAIATIVPIERTIFRTNIYLAESDNSRVNLLHLTFLSADILSDVRTGLSKGVLNHSDWERWILKTRMRECRGSWYELNISRLINCQSVRDLNFESSWILPD